MSPRGSISPIPKTRVEKVDDLPSHGEVPGTEAYRMREEDAQPDEIAITPEAGSIRSQSISSHASVPATLVEEAPGDGPGPHSAAFEEKRKADAPADVVLDAAGDIKAIKGDSSMGTGVAKP